MRNDVYICYSPKQKDWLCEKGFKYAVCGLNPNPPHKTFWCFLRNEKFNKEIEEWFEK